MLKSVNSKKFTRITILYLTTISIVLMLQYWNAREKIHLTISALDNYVQVLTKSRYLQQAVNFSSTGSAEKIIDDYVNSEPLESISAIFIHRDSHLMALAIRKEFENKITFSKIIQKEYDYILTHSLLENGTKVSAVVDLKSLKKIIPINDIFSHKKKKYHIDTLSLFLQNWIIYILITLMFFIVMLSFFLQEKAIRNAVFLYNKTLKHDLTEAVSVSGSAAFMIKKDLENPNLNYLNRKDQFVRLLDYVQVHLKYATQLVSQIGFDEKIENLEKKPTDLARILREFFNVTSDIYDNFKIEVEIRNNNILDINCTSFTSVLINLLNNAVKHGKGKLTFRSFDVEDGTELYFINPSKQVEAELKKIIFDPYCKGSQSKGSGLGLYRSKKIIENHNGYMTFDYKDGKAIVKIFLPDKNQNKKERAL